MKTPDSQVKIASVNPKIYPLDVIYSAAYIMLDNFYIIISGDPEKEVLVKMIPKEGVAVSGDPENLLNNELVNYAFYKKQSERNGDVRKMLLQRALLSAGEESAGACSCGQESLPQHDPIDDPEGIAIPWEEKFKKKADEADANKST